MGIYLYVSASIFLFFGIIWKRDGWLNMGFKTMFWGMGLWGLFNALLNSGFIIQQTAGNIRLF